MIPADVRAAVRAATKQATVEIVLRAPEVHQSNELFDVWVDWRHLIAKRYLVPEEQEGAPAREFASLQLLAPLDMAPQPIFHDATVGPVVIYEYMEGHMWGRYQPSVAELDALAAAMVRLHELPTAGLWPAHGSEMGAQARVTWFHALLAGYVAWAEAHFPAGLAAAQLCEPLIEEAGIVLHDLERTMPALVFCRSDPRFANVIKRVDGRLGFVDWEDAGLRDPALEVADMLLHPEQEDLLTATLADAFLASYCGYTGASQVDFAARVAGYCRVLPVFWVLIMLRYGVRMAEAGRLATWQSNGMASVQRLHRYLARALSGRTFEFDPNVGASVHFFPAE